VLRATAVSLSTPRNRARSPAGLSDARRCRGLPTCGAGAPPPLGDLSPPLPLPLPPAGPSEPGPSKESTLVERRISRSRISRSARRKPTPAAAASERPARFEAHAIVAGGRGGMSEEVTCSHPLHARQLHQEEKLCSRLRRFSSVSSLACAAARGAVEADYPHQTLRQL
jgi:hypothetical protein